MADKEYKIIKQTMYENRGNAPVYIDTSEVLRDTQKRKTVMRMKLFNNCPKTVKSVYFNAGCFDEHLNLCVQLKNIPYINVDAKPNTVFGETQVVEVPALTRSVFVEISKILFEDSSVWINEKQELAEDLVSEEAVGEEWHRLRLTKAIKDSQSKKEVPKRKSFKKKLMIWVSVLVGVAILGTGAYCVEKHFSERKSCYKTAMNLYINHDFANAAPALEKLNTEYKYFGNEKNEIAYSAGIAYMHNGNYKKAIEYLSQCGNYKHAVLNLRNITNMYGRLTAGGLNHSVVVTKQGTVSAFGDNSYGQCNTENWLGVIGVAACGNHTVGLTVDGKLFATGENDYGQCEVSGWTDVVQVATGNQHTVALKANGRVIARGNNNYGQCNVQEWQDIVQIAAAGNHTIGLKNDGTVLSIGWNNYGQCDVSTWTDILSVYTGEKNTVGVKYDGSVVAIGDNSRSQCSVSDIKNVVSAAVGNEYIICLDREGKPKSKGLNDKNQSAVSLWNDVISVSCGTSHTIGLNADRTVRAVGDDSDGKLKLSDLSDIGAENIPITE